jgi:hypothetical protein
MARSRNEPHSYVVYAWHPPYGFSSGYSCVVEAKRVGRGPNARERLYDTMPAAVRDVRTVRAYSKATAIEGSGVRCPNGRLKQRLGTLAGARRRRGRR